jgi:hypothetical protein
MHRPQPDRTLPDRPAAALHAAKIVAHRLRRLTWDRLIDPPQRWTRAPAPEHSQLAGRSHSKLWTHTDPAERALEAGKVHNLRLAARAFDGLYVPPGGVFSFWAHLGRPTARAGYAVGRELRQGCLIPSIGGGLCQISNSLYEAALDAGLPIIERHRHSRVVPGALSEQDRDATVFWNYVDLRFRAPRGLWITCRLTGDQLIVELRAPNAAPRNQRPPALRVIQGGPVANSCATCGQHACFRNADAVARRLERGRTAWLLDAHRPEFDRYLCAERGPDDVALLPINGRLLKWDRYAWSTQGMAVITAPHGAARRTLHARRLHSEGAARQTAALQDDALIAESLGRRIPLDCTHVVVDGTLLPHLWRGGWLGGRTFDVLLTRAPLSQLHGTLNRAAERWPQSRTLADFRADPTLISAEDAALAAARRIITPHAALARPFGPRAHRLPWATGQVVQPRPRNIRPVVVFPTTTLGRTGAYALREALHDLGEPIDLRLAGPVLEGGDFWAGLNARTQPWSEALAEADVVVAPAWVTHWPRRLLDALASGVPVIASPACGIEHPLLRLLEPGDPAALRQALLHAQRASAASAPRPSAPARTCGPA